MDKYILILKENRKLLVKYHEEMMADIRVIIDAVKLSEDEIMRDIVADMMKRANYISNSISILDSDIRDLKRKQERLNEEA